MSYETVDKLNRDFEDNYNNNLLKEAVSTYANDAKLFANDKQIYQGLNNIEKFYSDSRINGNTNVKLNTQQIIQCDSNYLIEIRFYFSTDFY
jgi:ketosteroid isomerase-like protein